MDITPDMIAAAKDVKATLDALEAKMNSRELAVHHNALGRLLDLFAPHLSASDVADLTGGADKSL